MNWEHSLCIEAKAAKAPGDFAASESIEASSLSPTSPKPEPSQTLKPSSEALQPSSSPIERRVLSRRTEVLETLDSENTILSRLRSVQVFDNKMKEDLLRLFHSHTPDPLTGMERTTDYWVQLLSFWIRMIHQKRTDLVHPDDEPSPIDAKRDNEFGDSLMADRYTYIVESQFLESNGTEIEDYWCSVRDDDGTVKEPEQDPRRDLFQAWRGFSVFVPIPIEYERAEQETSHRHARVPKGLKVPGEPSSSERKQHELTHLPFRDWCPHCVKAKGRHGPAKKQIDRQPVIQVDYCFSATNKDLPLQKILSAVDVISGLGMAVVVPSKGEIDYSVAELKKFIFECGRTFGVLQYDQESPLKALCQRVCSELGGLSLRAAPKEHSQSSGSVGQMQRTLYGQLRTLLYQVEHNTGFAIDSNSALYPWAVKHAQWLINRYLVHSDGFTSYFRRWNRNYEGGLCAFAECVQAKVITPSKARKADTPWKIALLPRMSTCLPALPSAARVIVPEALPPFRVLWVLLTLYNLRPLPYSQFTPVVLGLLWLLNRCDSPLRALGSPTLLGTSVTSHSCRDFASQLLWNICVRCGPRLTGCVRCLPHPLLGSACAACHVPRGACVACHVHSL